MQTIPLTGSEWLKMGLKIILIVHLIFFFIKLNFLTTNKLRAEIKKNQINL